MLRTPRTRPGRARRPASPSVAAPTLAALRAEMDRLADPVRAKNSAWFFKTGPGEYGAGDRFLGIPVPSQRRLARRWRDLPLDDLAALLESPWHEHRLVATFVLVRRFERAEGAARDALARFYLEHRAGLNGWDLVDSSAPHVLGAWLLDRPRAVLDRLARSRVLWDRRIAMLATQAFIRRGEFDDALRLGERLLGDREALMHKAVGWMLREIGDRDAATLRRFLGEHAPRMPRTMLRYAIEKFSPAERKRWLAVEYEGGRRR